MKILLTGACGLVGRATLSANAGVHQIVPFDQSEKVEAMGGVRASITDRDAVMRAAQGCHAIIHTAAMHGAFRHTAQPRQFIETNVIGTEYIFEAALAHGIRRLVLSSTLEVLCGVDWCASGITVYDQTTPPRPDGFYPLTKLMVEEMGHYYHRCHGLEVIQLRYAYVRDEPIDQIGLGLLARCVADVDVADINLLAATTPGLTDHVLLVGPDTPLTLADVMAAQHDPYAVLEKYWPGSRAVLDQHQLTPHPNHFWPVCRMEPVKQLLGWKPKVTFEHWLMRLGWQPPEPPNASRPQAASAS